MNDPMTTVAKVMYGKSDDPLHSDNVENLEFQAGYFVGEDSVRGIDYIAQEYQRRGEPVSQKELALFTDWKRGYWAARLRKAWNHAKYNAAS